MQLQERQCFLERCQVEPQLLKTLSALKDSFYDVSITDYSAIMIGGAGAYSAVNNYSWTHSLLQFVNQCISVEIPMFGSCWGHQIIARAAGGKVVHDSSKAEMGSVAVEVTESGLSDPLFRFMPQHFFANAGHHDRVVELPSHAVELAFNESQRNQAFRLGSLPIYGTQFHSELDAKTERERLIEYRDHYRDDIPSDAEFQRVLESLVDTSAADKLLRYFLDDFVL